MVLSIIANRHATFQVLFAVVCKVSERGAGRAPAEFCLFPGAGVEAAIGIEPMIKVLQTSALPLGYAAADAR